MPRRLRKWLLAGFAGAVVTGAVFCGWMLWVGVSVSVEAEKTYHGCCLVLDLLSVHVEGTHGQWPRSWEELAAESPSPRFAAWKWPGNRQQIQARIHLDFSLTCADVARMDAKNFRAVEQIGPNYGLPEYGIDELLTACRKYRRK